MKADDQSSLPPFSTIHHAMSNVANRSTFPTIAFVYQHHFSDKTVFWWKISNVTSNLTRVSGYQVILVIVVMLPNFIKIYPVKKITI